MNRSDKVQKCILAATGGACFSLTRDILHDSNMWIRTLACAAVVGIFVFALKTLFQTPKPE